VRALFAQMGRTGRMQITDEQHEAVTGDFDAAAVSDSQVLEQIRKTYERDGYILDPHTAVGVRAAADRTGVVCLATAHPAKFGDAVREAVGLEALPPTCLQGLLAKETRCALLDADEGAVRAHIRDTLSAK